MKNSTIDIKRFNELIKTFANKKIAVVGDLMLDRYFWGRVTRVSPEAPVPVVDLKDESYHLGGAANVSANLRSLGLNVIQCGLIGKDEMGYKLVSLSEKLGIDCKGIFADDTRPTTVKTRVFGNNQQIVRLDTENTEIVDNAGERHILNILHTEKNIDGVVFADYDKGVLTDIMIREVITECRNRDIPVFVDPKYDNFYDYSKVNLFKPNRAEAELSLNYPINSDESVRKAGKDLLNKLRCDNVLLTLGSQGMMLFESNSDVLSVPTKARNVADVSGAGDTVIATFCAIIAAGGSAKEAATIANIAAGIVCGKAGVVSVTLDEIKADLT
ncbi:D-glycero-beta-D-manno-heptose-7-phosphate kinase [Candidatus Kapabacteria bacterium]|nr:D-glycero-beta-D-manno-heptose-7-phosphate kinase [Candidatus Kapabacteria bacterium]